MTETMQRAQEALDLLAGVSAQFQGEHNRRIVQAAFDEQAAEIARLTDEVDTFGKMLRGEKFTDSLHRCEERAAQAEADKAELLADARDIGTLWCLSGAMRRAERLSLVRVERPARHAPGGEMSDFPLTGSTALVAEIAALKAEIVRLQGRTCETCRWAGFPNAARRPCFAHTYAEFNWVPLTNLDGTPFGCTAHQAKEPTASEPQIQSRP